MLSLRASAFSPKVRILETLPLKKSGFCLSADTTNQSGDYDLVYLPPHLNKSGESIHRALSNLVSQKVGHRREKFG